KRTRAATQDGAEGLGAAGRDDVAQNAPGNGADDGAGRAVVALAIIASVAIAIDDIIVGEVAPATPAIAIPIPVTIASGLIIAVARPAVAVAIVIARAGGERRRDERRREEERHTHSQAPVPFR